MKERIPYQYRASDWIPIKGFLDYSKRTLTPESVRKYSFDTLMSGAAGIIFYNLAVLGATCIGTVLGLEKLLN